MPAGTLLYAQSGGVTAVINATASAVIQAARARKVRVLAARNGILGALREDDVFVLTADHGCDPSDSSTDHTREHVPLLLAGKRVPRGLDLGVRDSFADLGATLAENFGLAPLSAGRSFLAALQAPSP